MAAVLAGGIACGGRSTGPVGFSAPRASDRAARALDGGAGDEASPVPADFRAHMTRLGDRFPSRGHGRRYQAVLWLNEVARVGWGDLPGELPDGSLVVEEVFDQDRRGDRPAGLFVMEKRAGAWRFVVVGTEGEVVADARVASCASCHREAPRGGLFVEVTREAR